MATITFESVDKIEELTSFPQHILDYNKKIILDLKDAYTIALGARKEGIDPSLNVECDVAFDLADRVDYMLNVKVSARLRELLKTHRSEDVALTIAEEIALGKFGYLSTQEALDLGVRVGLAVVTEGITAAPLQGISSVAIKKNEDGSNYTAISFAGPIRAAGGTEAAFAVVIADQIRKTLGLEKYRPNAAGDDEVGRMMEELRIYEREVGNFQFRVTDEDVRYALFHLPVEIDGVETNPVEVVVHRGLKRIQTDRVRGGALRVLNDGVIGRSRKLLKLLEDLSITDWNWLKDLRTEKQSFAEPSASKASYLQEVISGRPVISLPGKRGGLRLRYGRSINTGLSTVGIHPALAIILDYPIVVGTQIKVDIPGKAATIAFVDSIEPPIVRLKDGSIVKVVDINFANIIKGELDRIIYLGDILVSYGDFLENNINLPPSGYVEEWWREELLEAIKNDTSLEQFNLLTAEKILVRNLLQDPFTKGLKVDDAFTLSRKIDIPLHPRYLLYWDILSIPEITLLRSNLKVIEPEDHILAKSDPRTKGILEKLGVPHKVKADFIEITGDEAYILEKCLGLRITLTGNSWEDSLQMVTDLSGVKIRKKSSLTIGVRVGRPEKAMPRKMKPPVHILFPIGKSGGSTRDLMQATRNDTIGIELVSMKCTGCGISTFSAKCRRCGGNSIPVKYCPSCGRQTEGICSACKVNGLPYSTVLFPIKEAVQDAIKKIKYEPTPPLKGVRGLSNATKIPEALEKGLLRNKYGLSVYKDGTIRFDVTNLPLTHFTPKQIGTTVQRLKELGYTKDIFCHDLTDENQVIELLPQDVILPKESIEHLFNLASFLDELLTNVYGKKPYYNLKHPLKLIGHLIIGLAPHTSVGTIGRIIGFVSSQVCFAHPYWHSAKRRDCDGDGDSVMLLLDVLLNFSKDYLPAQIGGLMDAPLLIQPLILPHELQRQAHNFDLAYRYPLDFYHGTLRNESPQDFILKIDIVRKRLKDAKQFYGFGFTHPTTDISVGKERSSYSTLKSLSEKLERQIAIAEIIEAVDPNEVVASVLRTHILPDILGNMKAYTSQSFRCKACGMHFRRVPLKGNCLTCEGELQGSVTRASVEKYLKIGLSLCERYDVGEYLRGRLEIISNELQELFVEKEEKEQLRLTSFLPN